MFLQGFPLFGAFMMGLLGVVHYFPTLFGLLVIVSLVFFGFSFFSASSGVGRVGFLRLSSFPLGYFPVLFGFRGSSPVPAWSSCLSYAFSPIMGFSAGGFLLRVWYPCAFSFSVCAPLRCGSLRRVSAPFRPVLVSSGVSFLSVLRPGSDFSHLQLLRPYVWPCPLWCPSLLRASLSRWDPWFPLRRLRLLVRVFPGLLWFGLVVLLGECSFSSIRFWGICSSLLARCPWCFLSCFFCVAELCFEWCLLTRLDLRFPS